MDEMMFLFLLNPPYYDDTIQYNGMTVVEVVT